MTRIRLESDAYFRGLGWLVFAGVLLGFLLPAALLGWLGVIEMSHDVYGAFGTLATIAIGGISLVAGIVQRYGWADLEFGDDAITVTHGVARSARRTDRISRPPPGLPLSAIIQEMSLGNGEVAYYLAVHDGVHREPIEIAKQLRVDRQRLAEVAAEIERWGRAPA